MGGATQRAAPLQTPRVAPNRHFHRDRLPHEVEMEPVLEHFTIVRSP
jgi:hypothetical protein